MFFLKSVCSTNYEKNLKNIKSKFKNEANDKKRALPSLLLKICKPSYFLCANYCQLKNGKGDC